MDEENIAQFHQQPADVCSLDWYIGPNQTQISWDCMVQHTALSTQYVLGPAQNEETEPLLIKTVKMCCDIDIRHWFLGALQVKTTLDNAPLWKTSVIHPSIVAILHAEDTKCYKSELKIISSKYIQPMLASPKYSSTDGPCNICLESPSGSSGGVSLPSCWLSFFSPATFVCQYHHYQHHHYH